MMRFTKMHGAGNDYVYINGFDTRLDDLPALARRMSEARFGVGADGLIVVLPSERADFRMRMFNRDGSEGAMCGNGARCVGRFVYEKGLTAQTAFTLESRAGLHAVTLRLDGRGRVTDISVDMGVPTAIRQGAKRTLLSVGSPHCVHFTREDPFEWDAFDALARPVCLAEDANVEYVQVLAPDALRMRVYERGSGETLACGSGACAAVVAARLAGLCGSEATVRMRGGDVRVLLRPDGHVLLTGPAVTVFEGEWPCEDEII